MDDQRLSIQVGVLRESELAEAGRIVRLAFGTFLGMANPLDFMGDRDFVSPRWRAPNTKVLAARENGKLIGLNILTRWGSFGFFGPLTVLPDYWNHGVAQRLLAATTKIFYDWGVSRSGLFTFPHSAKHVGLYQRFGYWPGYLTALTRRTPEAKVAPVTKNARPAVLLSTLTRADREKAIRACAKLTGALQKGLDLSQEIAAVLAQRIGEVILVPGRNSLDGFAICMFGAGSEGGEKTVYVKFAAARDGSGAADRFICLLDVIEELAVERRADVEAGVSLACEPAFRLMQARGYRATTLGVAMQRPHGDGLNRRSAYVICDWR
ncbi:MAG: GNAT family N-acetyltransferase [Terracidiphilus sp.]